MLVHSDTLSIDYTERVKAIANCSIWAEQVDNKSTQLLSLSYVTVKERMNNSITSALSKEIIF